MLLRDRYPGLTYDLLRNYVGIRHELVRGDVQINDATPRAKGRRLLPVEVVCAFGQETYKKIQDEGVAVIQARANSSSRMILERLESLRLTISDLAERMSFDRTKLQEYLDGIHYFPIRLLEQACFHLGLDDGRVSAETIAQNNPRVRLRYYDKNKGDERLFKKEIVFEIAEEAWKLQKLSYLRELNRVFSEYHSVENAKSLNLIDGEYIARGHEKPTVRMGEIIAEKTRRSINLVFRDFQQVNLGDAFAKVGVPAFTDILPNDYSGLTLVNNWDDSRSVVANTYGMNSIYEIMRFTLAHELGHAVSDPSAQFVELRVGDNAGAAAGSVNKDKGSVRDYPELRANSFAINFLAPEKEVENVINQAKKDENIEELIARKFGISAVAAGFRIKQVKNSIKTQARVKDFFNENSIESVPPLDEALTAEANIAVQNQLIHPDTAASIQDKIEIKKRRSSVSLGGV